MRAIPDPLYAHAQTIPDSMAIELRDGSRTKSLSYRELNDLVTRTASDANCSDFLKSVLSVLRGFRTQSTVDLSHPEFAPPDMADLRQEDPVWHLEHVLFSVNTSGSTKAPKKVDVTTEQVFFSAMGATARIGHHLSDRWYCPLPIFHIGGISVLLRTLLLGTTSVFERFSPSSLARVLEQGECTISSVVPTMIARLLKEYPALAPSPSFRALIVGGAGLPNDLYRKAIALNIPLCRSYGSSETAAMVATDAPPPPGFKESQRGIPLLPFVSLKSKQERITVSGPQVQSGHWHSNDMGTVTNRRVVISGRSDRVIVCGGRKINPQETEAALLSHPGIRSAVCLPWADPEDWGTIMIGFIEPGEPPYLPLDQIWKQLPSEQKPKAFVFAPIAETQMGKITEDNKKALLQKLEQIKSKAPVVGRCFSTTASFMEAAQSMCATTPEKLFSEENQ